MKDHRGSGHPYVTDDNGDAYIINEIQAMTFKTHECCNISPDMRLIEHVWDILGGAVAEIDPAPAALEDLLLHLQVEWSNVTQRKITKLMRSMDSRVRTCIAAQGGPTHY